MTIPAQPRGSLRAAPHRDIVLVALLLSGGLAAAGEVATADRAASLAATRHARPVHRSWPECPPLGAQLTEWRDAAGVARRAVLDYGSDDSAFRVEMFRDREGHARVVLISGGAVSGARLTHRITFGPNDRRRSEARSVTEPGYTFPYPWPEQGSPA